MYNIQSGFGVYQDGKKFGCKHKNVAYWDMDYDPVNKTQLD